MKQWQRDKIGARGDRKPSPSHKGASDSRPLAAKHPASPSPFRTPSAELVVLYGYHPIREALRANRRKMLGLFATANAAARLQSEADDAGVPVMIVEAAALDRRLGDDVHQGLLLEARPLPALDIADVASDGGVLVVLDGITDPHNVGAILRTAAAFAARGLVMTDRNSPPLDGVLAKAASGALEHVPVVHVTNLARALDQIGEHGFHRIGLDSDAAADFADVSQAGATALVLGAEGSGLRRLTRERCDVVARLTLPGAIHSLNVSTACAAALAIRSTRLA